MQKSITALTIKTRDKPGLLAQIGKAFEELNVRVHKAQIITLGHQVEDVFFITDRENKPFKSRQQQIKLRQRILFYLEGP